MIEELVAAAIVFCDPHSYRFTNNQRFDQWKRLCAAVEAYKECSGSTATDRSPAI